VAGACSFRTPRSIPPSPVSGKHLGLAGVMALDVGVAALLYTAVLW
jgi:hypothetical protein